MIVLIRDEGFILWVRFYFLDYRMELMIGLVSKIIWVFRRGLFGNKVNKEVEY